MADETTAILALKASTDKTAALVDRALAMVEKIADRNQALTDEILRRSRADQEALFGANGIYATPDGPIPAATRAGFGPTIPTAQPAENRRVRVFDDGLGNHDIPEN